MRHISQKTQGAVPYQLQIDASTIDMAIISEIYFFRCRQELGEPTENPAETSTDWKPNACTAPGLGIEPGLSGEQRQGRTARPPAQYQLSYRGMLTEEWNIASCSSRENHFKMFLINPENQAFLSQNLYYNNYSWNKSFLLLFNCSTLDLFHIFYKNIKTVRSGA